MPELTANVLRVLHLEDNAADFELVSRTLHEGGIRCLIIHAWSGAEFAAALSREKFDLILADFTMPGFDGTAALAMAREKCPEVPCVVVSGTIGEERAIESLKNGATDYVLKDRLERLIPAVRRATREAVERSRRRADEAALRDSEERFREMAGRIEDVFWISAPDGHDLRYVSPAYERIWGRPLSTLYVRPAEWIEAVVPSDRPAVRTARAGLSRGEESRIEYRIRRPDGSLRWINDRSYLVRFPSGEIKHAVGIAIDITRRKELEAELLQAQKMEAIGQLAGGVAHDFNNVLTVVTGYARLLLDNGSMPPSAIEPLTQIYTAGTRAANLTRQLLVFSRKQAVERRVLDLNEIVDETSRMLGRLIGEHIALQLALSPAPATVEADPGMLEQVLVNLTVNARDAMSDGGNLTIGIEPVTLPEGAARPHADARAGDFVCLSVRDTGCGIPPENLTHIFEPFFTTKEAGRGTGLGLAMVFGIVQQHQGWVEVESTVGIGSCFRVFLPSARRKSPPPQHPPAQPGASHGGSETILFVEDEPAVRDFAVTVLRDHGYRVLQACSGAEALEVWRWHKSRIALLFTDLVMPDTPAGVELAATLRQETPSLRVVFASGYPGDLLDDAPGLTAGTYFIQKPYKPQALADMVRAALDGQPHRA